MKRERRGGSGARRAAFLSCVLWTAAGFVATARDNANAALSPRLPQYESPAAASLDPDRVDFGKQVVGRWSRAQRIVVTNTGGATLYVSSAVVGGEHPGTYTVVNDTCTGAEVVPYRACTVDVSFAPSGTDDFNAELQLTVNTPGSPQTVRLTGEGMNSINVPPGRLAGPAPRAVHDAARTVIFNSIVETRLRL